ncbi:hypothetical protein UY3_07020 [Chelonia mydas]|uniref:PH domain-containing protein n=1 Tax=Chelonia mydas TaxID=8469 RepID=M7BUM6_CHEMY|nr:hypothetical protein UY3_07020 [Chelonia mydas]
MNMVKNKELSIEGALDLAQKETHAEKEAMNLVFPMDSQDLLTGSQFNFSVYKYKRYRWQKRILQIDFNTETIFNIEKGIIKKQFPFPQVKSCEDSEGRRFSIAFHGRPHYELEAMSLEDKRKISHLVNKVTQSNSYRRPVEFCSGRPAKCDVIHEGLLDLQEDSYASIKWVKYLVQLSETELSLSCIGNNGENKNADPVAKTINLSGGNVSVIKENGYDTFSIQTKEHNYLFRIPFTVLNNRAEDISKLQNEWVSLIDRYLPTPKDLEMYQSFKGSPSELHVVDQFMLELSLLRGKEKKITLLHALVEQIFLHEPDLAKFSQELTEFEAVPGASIKGLRAEVDVLKKELENVIQYRKFIKSKTIKATTQESQFYKELKIPVSLNSIRDGHDDFHVFFH